MQKGLPMSSKKIRADKALVKRGLAEDEKKALRLILAAQVYVVERKISTPGELLDENEVNGLRIRKSDPYVSRAAHKLLGAFESFDITVEGLRVIDVGSSTGGFTQVLLEQGAEKVYAVDVGYGLLDHSLRNDPKVIVLERENMRYLEREKIPEILDFFTMDVSFISSKLLLSPLKRFLKENAQGVVLIKPQFEAQRESVHKGIVTDPLIHRQVIEEMLEYYRIEGWRCLGLARSPVKGTKGNQEFLAWVELAPYLEIDEGSLDALFEVPSDSLSHSRR